ncbi:T9SS type A sorting domain-containing protein [Candidatus Marinimicrobia bacterium]|nr:T9SS type A sorting domain-containing protein [Candidatus Neomarinimicrobiota bacterium]
MLKFKFIILGFILISKSFTQEIIVISHSFTIDTIAPQLELFSPVAGSEYQHGSTVPVSWIGSDDSPAPNPIVINASAYLDDPYFELANQISNNGHYNLPTPTFINSSFVSVRIDMIDYYGNITYAYNSGYFTIGSPPSNDIIVTTFYEEFTSTIIVMDTKKPTVDLLSPNDQMVYEPGESVSISWEAVDENLLEDSGISLHLLADNGLSEYLLIENAANSSPLSVIIPNIETQFGQFKVSAMDYFGNLSNDLSDEYIVIGTENESDFEVIESIDSSYTSSITVDTKPPEFLHLSEEGNYFYPNGGEVLTDYSVCPLNWDCNDDSFQNGTVTVSLAYLLGGWYVDIGTFHHQDFYLNPVDLSLGGIVDETLWARLLFTVTDDYGNQFSKYNDDYFVLGDSEGDLDINWVDEDSEEIMINWGWEAKHSVMIKRSAIANYLQPGDKITLVDNLGIPSSSCDDTYGYTELKEITINESGSIGGPKSILRGIDHCLQQGQRREGFVEGNPIIFKITNITDASYYFVYPNAETIIGNANYTSGGHTVVKNIDFSNPITIENYNPLHISNNERDFDSFNVYYKVNAANLRDCGAVIQGNNDSNGDGISDPNWCFDTTIQGETDYLTQLPTITQSSILTYRVWLMNNSQQEVFKTVDTQISIDVELSDIYDKSLYEGWNWFSLNLTNSDMSINNILSSLNTTLVDSDYIKNQTSFSDYFSSFGWFGGLDTFDNLSTYKIKLNNPGNITYEGASVSLTETSIDLDAGWNWISYLPQESMEINTAFQNINNFSNGDYIKNQTSFSEYFDGFGFFGTLQNLIPREGYVINLANPATLVYPESNNFLVSTTPDNFSRTNAGHYFSVNPSNFEHSGTMIASLDLGDYVISENDEIGIFFEGDCRGKGTSLISPFENDVIFYLMFYSNDENEELDFIFYDSINNKEISLKNNIIFTPDMHLGEISDPYILSENEVYTYSLSKAYPNPFNPTTTIQYSLADNVDYMNLNIFDLRGRLIENLFSGSNHKGEHAVIWNASNHASGVYFINMVVGNQIYNEKIILLK